MLRNRMATAVLLGFALGLAGRSEAQATYHDASSGDWASSSTWSPSGSPGSSDTADVGTFVITVSSALSVNVLNFSGGQINGTGSLMLEGAGSTWSAGYFNSLASLTVGGSGGLTLSGSGGTLDLTGTALTNNGVVQWNSGTLRTSYSAGIVNNGTWSDQATATILNPSGGSPVFTNAVGGGYLKTAGTTTIDIPFVNSGTVDASGGVLQFNGGLTINSGSTLDGSGGTLETIGATTVANGPFNSDAFILAGGVYSGAMDFNGTLTWNSGFFSNSGSTSITVGSGSVLTIATGNTHDFQGTPFVNNGTVNWTGGGVRSGSGGSATNNGVWNDSASSAISNAWGGAFTFTNSVDAHYNVTSGSSAYDVPFDNIGTIAVENGSSLVTVAGGTLENASTLDGSGGTLTLDGGTYAADGTVYVEAVHLSGGQINGQFSLVGSFNWDSGNFSSGGTTVVTVPGQSAMTVETGNTHDFESSAIINDGTIYWTGGGLRTGNGGSFTNNGVFNDSAGSGFSNAWGGSAVFTNAATAVYNLTGGTSAMQISFTNAGTVDVSAGTFLLQSGGTFDSGSVLNGSGGSIDLTGGKFTGLGNVAITNLVLAGAEISGTPTFSGNLEWTSGDMDSPNTTSVTFDQASTLTVDSGNTHDFQGSAMTNYGTVNWTGGALRSGNGGSFANFGTFNDTASNSINNPWDNTFTFTNEAGGLYEKTAAGTTTIGVPFVNSGTVTVQEGSLVLSYGGSTNANGSFNAGQGTAVTFAGQTFSATNGSVFNGPGGYFLTGGVLSLTGSVSFDSFQQTGGALAGTMTFQGVQFEWSGGDWNQVGTLTLGADTALTVDTGNNHDFQGAAVVNNGTVNWVQGAIRTGDGGSFTNNGTINDSAGSSFNNPWGNGALFTNSAGGLYNKTSGASSMQIPFTNSGTVQVTGGEFDLTAGGTFNGGSALDGSGGPIQLTGGTYAASGTIAVDNVTLAGAVITGTPTFSGTFTWTSGNLDSAGTTSITFDGLSTLTIASGNNHDFQGSAITSDGTVEWTGGGIRDGLNGTFTNNGTFNDSASAAISDPWDSSFAFKNAAGATYNKTAAGTTNIGAIFQNSGTVAVQAGTLILSNGGSSNSLGSFTAAAGTAVDFGGGTFSATANSVFGGAGLYELTAGVLDLSGGVSFSNLQQTGGSLADTMTLMNVQYEWTAGNWDQAGTVTMAGTSTLTIDSANNHDFYGADVVNNGTVNWQNGAIRTGNGGFFTNNGTFNDSASVSIYDAWDNSFVFTNSLGATYNKTAAGTTTLAVTFNDLGTVDVHAGTLNLSGGGSVSASGAFSTSAGALTEFTGGTMTVSDGASFEGAGSYLLSGGTLDVSGAVTSSNFQQTGGLLGGSMEFDSTGFEWTAGTWNAATSVTFGSGSTLTIDSGNNHDFYGAAVVSNGTVNWQDGAIRTGNGGTFKNNGTFNDSASTPIYDAWDNTFVFTNGAGATYNKTAAGTTAIDVAFQNAGTVDVQAGTLDLGYGGSEASTSVFTTASGATTEFSGGTFLVSGGAQFGGQGSYLFSGGILDISGGVSFGSLQQTGGTLADTMALQGTQFEWTGGTWDQVGTVTLAGTTTLTIDSGNNHDFYSAAVVNNGVVNWQDGTIRSGNGGSFTNNGTFNDTASYYVTNAWDTSFSFTNAASGTYNKIALGTTSFGVPFNNAGVVSVQSGILYLTQGGSLSGSGFMTEGPGVTDFGGGTFTLADGSSFGGEGLYVLGGGTLTSAGTVSFSSIQQVGGELAGTPTFASTAFEWTAGDWNAATSVAFDSQSVLTIDSANNHDLNGASLSNFGTVNWTDGAIRGGNGSSIQNYAAWNAMASDQMSAAYGGSMTFNNEPQGSFNVANGVSIQFNSVLFLNSGVVSAGSGSISFAGGYSDAGGTLALGGGSVTFPSQASLPTGRLVGNGTVTATTLTVGGTVAPATAQGAGLLSVTGNMTFLPSSALNIEIGGLAAGSQYDQVAVSGTADLGGTLDLNLAGGFQTTITPQETFVILTSTSLLGSFTNVASGSSLSTMGGFGSFTVNYGPSSAFGVDDVVLSNFTPVPEPSTYAQMGLGAAALFAARRLWASRRPARAGP